MNQPISPEVYWLALTAVMTALLWIPYILQLLVQMGPVGAMMDGEGTHPHAANWAIRAKKAHYNAIENLAVFAPLVLIVEVMETGDGLTWTAAQIFFFARLAHYVIYTFGWPVIRTVAFLVGFGCQLTFALRIFGLA